MSATVDMDLIRRITAEQLGHSHPQQKTSANVATVSAAIQPEVATETLVWKKPNHTEHTVAGLDFQNEQDATLMDEMMAHQAWLEKKAAPVPGNPAIVYPTSLEGWALWAVARGWYVFPCDPGGKEPATKNGVLDASNDPAQIRAWWTKNPYYNPAIALGPSNLVGYDFDSIAPFADLPATLTVRSGRILKDGEAGGIHMYYRGLCRTHSIFVEPVLPITEKETVDKQGNKIIQCFDALTDWLESVASLSAK